MNLNLFFRFLLRSRALLGGAGLTVLALYLIYVAILRLGVISPLGPGPSFSILSKIINLSFILATTAVVLSIIAYTLSKTLPRAFFAPLSPDASASLATRIVNLTFIGGLATIVFATVAYTLPRLLPSSLFEPVPQVEYAVAVARMFDPFEESGVARVMDSLELYPGFPYYSRESDHPAAWPARVDRDRQALFEAYSKLLDQFPIEQILAEQGGGGSVEILGPRRNSSGPSRVETIANLRLWFNSTLNGDRAALERALGREAALAFLRIEEARSALREQFPNRLAVMRIRNTGKLDAQDVTIELDLYGRLYDYAISADPDQVRDASYDVTSKRIVIERMLPGYSVEIRFWYDYYSVENRFFADKMDYILELSQGVVINNFAVSGGRAEFNAALVENFAPYEPLFVGPALKKDDYTRELQDYFEKRGDAAKAASERYAEEHPSFRNVSPEWLAASERPDNTVNAVWIAFDSPDGNPYKAIHVFSHQSGPYILLCSTAKDRDDLVRVAAAVEEAFDGEAEREIFDRQDDICATIRVVGGFSQKGLADKVRLFYRPAFRKVDIEAVHY